jgi:hypothetical protein
MKLLFDGSMEAVPDKYMLRFLDGAVAGMVRFSQGGDKQGMGCIIGFDDPG